MNLKQKYNIALKDIIAEKIKTERKTKKITQTALTKGICSQSQLSRLEQGLDIPNVSYLLKICDKLDISLKYLIDETQTDLDKIMIEFENKAEELVARKAVSELNQLIAENETLRIGSINVDIRHKQYYRYIIGIIYLLKFELLSVKEREKPNGRYLLTQAEIILTDTLSLCNYKALPAIALRIKILNGLTAVRIFSNNLQIMIPLLQEIEDDALLLDKMTYSRILITYYYNLSFCYKIVSIKKHKIYLEKAIDLSLMTRCIHSLDTLYYALFCTYLNDDGSFKHNKAIEAFTLLDKAIAIAKIFDNQNFHGFLISIKAKMQIN